MEKTDPIRFRSAQEFMDRPLWRRDVNPSTLNPERIIGDYEFTEAEALTCGLSGCHREHWHGFVVATRDGFETHIGRDCAKRHCGLNWGELQSQFRKEADDRDRRLWLDGMLTVRDSMLTEAISISREIDTITQEVKDVLDLLRKERDIDRAFRDAQRSGGTIRVEREVDKDTAERMGLKEHERHQLETVGSIAAIGVTIPPPGSSTLPGKRIFLALKDQAIPVLNGLNTESLRNLSHRKRQEKTAEVERAQESIGNAKQHLAAAKRFLDPENLKGIGKFEIPHPSQRATRILRRFINGGDDGSA